MDRSAFSAWETHSGSPSEADLAPAFHDSEPSKIIEGFPDTAEVSPSRVVEYRQRHTGAFSVNLDLHAFPADRHLLSIQFVCPSYSTRELILPSGVQSGTFPRLSLQAWNVGMLMMNTNAVVMPDGTEVSGNQNVSINSARSRRDMIMITSRS